MVLPPGVDAGQEHKSMDLSHNAALRTGEAQHKTDEGIEPTSFGTAKRPKCQPLRHRHPGTRAQHWPQGTPINNSIKLATRDQHSDPPPGRGAPGGPRPSPSWAQAWPPLVPRRKVTCLPAPQQRKRVARRVRTSAWLVNHVVVGGEGDHGGAKLPPPGTS